jgi:hypothetical protein
VKPTFTEDEFLLPESASDRRCYRAEAWAENGKILWGVKRMQKYADTVMRSAWFRKRFPDVPKKVKIRLKPKPANRPHLAASSGVDEISVYGAVRCEKEILHELAHIASQPWRINRSPHG